MASDDLINFDVIESQKENIQALPSGRSAKKLAELFSPSPLQHKQLASTPTPSDTKNINDCIRAEYEAEMAAISEVDDPLDVYDRYVRWTLDAYPSAQATPASQLHTLLERATKAFVNAPQYKNDPRYLKLWLLYIQFFSDSPRETFVFLSRHAIAETLALFYEEYAGWLEGAGRWAQAEEVYKLGIEREARPTARLIRKFGEFEQRRAVQQSAEDRDRPASPALPTVRPALAAKVDPFAAAAAAMRDPQAPRPTSAIGGGQSSKAGRSKLTIFSDADAAAPSAMSARGPESKGWDTIGSLTDRKKENVMEPKPWAGETLKAGGKKSKAPKMEVFRDTSAMSQQLSQSHIPIHHSKVQVTVNPVNGKRERVFVDLRAVYPTPDEPGTELSFEEIWAANRGWLDQIWEDEVPQAPAFVPYADENSPLRPFVDENTPPNVGVLAKAVSQKLVVHRDVLRLDENGAPIYPKESKPRKKKVIEVNETQIIKAKLDSPSRPKLKKRNASAEPTMTLHTKAATDDIYDIFNAPIKPAQEGLSDDEGGYDSDDYTSGGESTCTTKNISVSEAGDDEDVAEAEVEGEPEDETSDVKSVSEWSEFSTRRHIPGLGEEDEERNENDTQVSDLIDINDQGESTETVQPEEDEDEDDGLPRTRTVFVPIPPEDYVPPARRTYRDPVEMANNRLPFMTPITERTESSLDITSEHAAAKTPCKTADGVMYPIEDDEEEEEEDDVGDDLEPMSSPLREVSDEEEEQEPEPPQPKPKMPSASALPPKTKPALAPKVALGPKGPALAPKGPAIKDAQCNPIDDAVREEILSRMHPPLGSYEGFYDHRHERYEKGGEIRKFTKSLAKGGAGSRNSTDNNNNDNNNNDNNNKTGNICTGGGGGGGGVVLQFPDAPERIYTVRKELGAGAFAPVYLVENSCPTNGESGDENAVPVVMMGRGAFASAHNTRHEREALKMEAPPSAWEFYMMRLAHVRLGPRHRATMSLSPALEMHLYADEGFLFLPFYPHGTLLDVVNLFRGEPSGVMDEQLAMFFSIELFRTVEGLHSKGLMHGDLKADNCLLRLGRGSSGGGLGELSGGWNKDGEGGWSDRGVMLIDFGRAIDMKAFREDVQFIADWKTTAADCAEMREGRPWTWQIDYHGLAGILHCLLFGKYIETVRADAGGLGTQRRYKIRESLKRYWQTDIWGGAFDLLLNPAGFTADEEGHKMPVLKGMRGVREKMEHWLEHNCERGLGLRGLMGKVEAWARGRR